MNRRQFFHGGICAAAVIAGLRPSRADFVVETTQGSVRGLAGHGCCVFKGIPYGASTTGANRFQPPKAPAAWTGVRDCVQYGNSAPQHKGLDADDVRATGRLHASWKDNSPTSEDCLVLNVWTPALDDAKRPVMVWLHYGGFEGSSGSMPFNDGENLARKQDVVLVTLNHRLGLFGYLHLKYSGRSKFGRTVNIGQQDIIAALQWVRDNIESFGGDPSRVMIFGQSGGGSKVAALMATPSARGFFHRAAIHSTTAPGLNGEEAERSIAAVLSQLGLSDPEKLSDVPMATLLSAWWAARKSAGFKSVIDGVFQPGELFKRPANVITPLAKNVPLLIGNTLTEGTVNASNHDFGMDWNAVRRRIAAEHPANTNISAILDTWRHLRPDVSPAGVFFEIDAFLSKTISFDRLAIHKNMTQPAPAFRYTLEWETPVQGGKYRSPHTLDLPLVFDTIAFSKSMIGGGAEDAQRVSTAMSRAWGAFAHTGSPSTPELPWTQHIGPARMLMRFNVTSGQASNPYSDRYAVVR